MDTSFDIIEYLSGMTGFVFDKAVLKRIAMDRGVENVSHQSELNSKTKELLFADLLRTAYLSPDKTASSTTQHGNFVQTVGSQTIRDKYSIYKMMMRIYGKYDDEAQFLVPEPSTLQWLE